MSYSTIWRANEAREVLGLSTYQRNGRKYIWARQMKETLFLIERAQICLLVGYGLMEDSF